MTDDPKTTADLIHVRIGTVNVYMAVAGHNAGLDRAASHCRMVSNGFMSTGRDAVLSAKDLKR